MATGLRGGAIKAKLLEGMPPMMVMVTCHSSVPGTPISAPWNPVQPASPPVPKRPSALRRRQVPEQRPPLGRIPEEMMAVDNEAEMMNEETEDEEQPVAERPSSWRASAQRAKATAKNKKKDKKKKKKQGQEQDACQDRRDYKRWNQAHAAKRRMEHTLFLEQEKREEAEGEVWSLEDSVKILQTEMQDLGQQQAKYEAAMKELTATFKHAVAKAKEDKDTAAGEKTSLLQEMAELKGHNATLTAKLNVAETQIKRTQIQLGYEQLQRDQEKDALKKDLANYKARRKEQVCKFRH